MIMTKYLQRCIDSVESSINNKWEPVAAGKKSERGTYDCSCCTEFLKEEGCGDCPVKRKTGRHFCKGTPYQDWEKYFDYPDPLRRRPRLRRVYNKETKKIADRELKFLKDLLQELKELAKEEEA